METLYVWNDKGKKEWLNHVYIYIDDNGVAIYQPFFKFFIPSILLPWEALKIKSIVYKGPLKYTKLFPKIEIEIIDTELSFALNAKYKKEISMYKTRISRKGVSTLS